MQLIHTTKKSLKAALAAVCRFVPTRSSDPARVTVRLAWADTTLTVTGRSAGGSVVWAELPIEASTGGRAYLGAHLLHEIVKGLPGDLIEMRVADTTLALEAGGAARVLGLADVADGWQDTPEVAPVVAWAGSLPGADLLRVAAGADKGASRAAFKGVTVHAGGLVSSDSYTITHVPVDLPGVRWGAAAMAAGEVLTLGRAAGNAAPVSLAILPDTSGIEDMPGSVLAGWQAGGTARQPGRVYVRVMVPGSIVPALSEAQIYSVSGGAVVGTLSTAPGCADGVEAIGRAMLAASDAEGLGSAHALPSVKSAWGSDVHGVLLPSGGVALRAVACWTLNDKGRRVPGGYNSGTVAGVAFDVTLPAGAELALCRAAVDLLNLGGAFEVQAGTRPDGSQVYKLRRVECGGVAVLGSGSFVPDAEPDAVPAPEPAQPEPDGVTLEAARAVVVAAIAHTEAAQADPVPGVPAESDRDAVVLPDPAPSPDAPPVEPDAPSATPERPAMPPGAGWALAAQPANEYAADPSAQPSRAGWAPAFLGILSGVADRRRVVRVALPPEPLPTPPRPLPTRPRGRGPAAPTLRRSWIVPTGPRGDGSPDPVTPDRPPGRPGRSVPARARGRGVPASVLRVAWGTSTGPQIPGHPPDRATGCRGEVGPPGHAAPPVRI